MSGVPMKDVCSDEGCNIMFHHACQTEWEFHQYRLKYPEGDPSKCAYDSDGKKKCMRHHPFSALAMSTAVPDVQFGPHHNDEFEDYANVEQNEDKTPKKGKSNNINTPAKLTKQQKTEQKQQRMQLLRTMTTEAVVLNDAGDDVESIGGINWSKLGKEEKLVFIQANKISTSQALRNTADLGKNIANHINAGSFQNHIKSKIKQKKADITKPLCITKAGTMWRLGNTLLKYKESYIALREINDRDEQDTRQAKPVAYETLHKGYHLANDEDLNRLSPTVGDSLVGFGIPPDVCTDYDELPLAEFKECIGYLNACYRQARNKQTASGNHSPISRHTGGKIYLIYWDTCLREIGGDFQMCAFPELDKKMQRSTNTAGIPKRRVRRGSSSASERSLSPLPNNNVRAGRAQAAEATEEAADAIRERNSEMTYHIKFDRMMKMKKDARAAEENIEGLKRKYKAARQDNKDRSYLDRVRKKRDGIKSDLRACLQEYNRIKLEIGYTSPPPSDNDGADSLSDESHAANNNENNDDGHESA